MSTTARSDNKSSSSGVEYNRDFMNSSFTFSKATGRDDDDNDGRSTTTIAAAAQRRKDNSESKNKSAADSPSSSDSDGEVTAYDHTSSTASQRHSQQTTLAATSRTVLSHAPQQPRTRARAKTVTIVGGGASSATTSSSSSQPQQRTVRFVASGDVSAATASDTTPTPTPTPTPTQSSNDSSSSSLPATKAATAPPPIMTSVKVFCRVRPFVPRELQQQQQQQAPDASSFSSYSSSSFAGSLGTAPRSLLLVQPPRSVVSMSATQTFFLNHKSKAYDVKEVFNFDENLWSIPPEQHPVPEGVMEIADQRVLFEKVGRPVVDAAWAGFHSCVFAYGQTGSGKTHTMMGSPCGDASSSSSVPTSTPTSTTTPTSTGTTIGSGSAVVDNLRRTSSWLGMKPLANSSEDATAAALMGRHQHQHQQQQQRTQQSQQQQQEAGPTLRFDGLIPAICEHLFETVKEADKRNDELDESVNCAASPLKKQQQHRQSATSTATAACFSSPSDEEVAARRDSLELIAESTQDLIDSVAFGCKPTTTRSLGKRMRVSYRVDARFFEIYNEKVHDLLWEFGDVTEQEKNGWDKGNLKVRNVPGQGPFVLGLTTIEVRSWQHCLELIELGSVNRSVASTRMNERSSRAHTIFRLSLSQIITVFPKKQFEKPQHETRTCDISLVDLAGSERNKKSGAVGQRLKEAAAINQSLTTLKNCIDALTDRKKASVVPYRESQLTWLLSESLGGNSRTYMIACVSPHTDSGDETYNTLRYAHRAQGIVLKPKSSETNEARRLLELRRQLEDAQRELTEGKAAEAEALQHQITATQLQLERMTSHIDTLEEQESVLETNLEEERETTFSTHYMRCFHLVFLERMAKFIALDGETLAVRMGVAERDKVRSEQFFADAKLLHDHLEEEEEAAAERLFNTAQERDGIRDATVRLQTRIQRWCRQEEELRQDIENKMAQLRIAGFISVFLVLLEDHEQKDVTRRMTANFQKRKSVVTKKVEDESDDIMDECDQCTSELQSEQGVLKEGIVALRQRIAGRSLDYAELIHKLQKDIIFLENELQTSEHLNVADMVKQEDDFRQQFELYENNVRGLHQQRLAEVHVRHARELHMCQAEVVETRRAMLQDLERYEEECVAKRDQILQRTEASMPSKAELVQLSVRLVEGRRFLALYESSEPLYRASFDEIQRQTFGAAAARRGNHDDEEEEEEDGKAETSHLRQQQQQQQQQLPGDVRELLRRLQDAPIAPCQGVHSNVPTRFLAVSSSSSPSEREHTLVDAATKLVYPRAVMLGSHINNNNNNSTRQVDDDEAGNKKEIVMAPMGPDRARRERSPPSSVAPRSSAYVRIDSLQTAVAFSRTASKATVATHHHQQQHPIAIVSNDKTHQDNNKRVNDDDDTDDDDVVNRKEEEKRYVFSLAEAALRQRREKSPSPIKAHGFKRENTAASSFSLSSAAAAAVRCPRQPTPLSRQSSVGVTTRTQRSRTPTATSATSGGAGIMRRAHQDQFVRHSTPSQGTRKKSPSASRAPGAFMLPTASSTQKKQPAPAVGSSAMEQHNCKSEEPAHSHHPGSGSGENRTWGSAEQSGARTPRTSGVGRFQFRLTAVGGTRQAPTRASEEGSLKEL